MNTIYIYIDAAGEFRWRLRSRNGRTLCDSGEGYKKLARCMSALAVSLGVQFEPGDQETDSQFGRRFKMRWNTGNQFNAKTP